MVSYGWGLEPNSRTYLATAIISSGFNLSLNDFMLSPLPCVSMVTTESSVRDVMKAVLNVAIFGYFSFIVLGGLPITP